MVERCAAGRSGRATRAVFGVLLRHVEPGQIIKVQGVLPTSIQAFWESIQVERELALADG